MSNEKQKQTNTKSLSSKKTLSKDFKEESLQTELEKSETALETVDFDEVLEKTVEIKKDEVLKQDKQDSKLKIGDSVLTPFGNESLVYDQKDDFFFVRKTLERKKLYKFNSSQLKLIKKG